MRLRRIRRTRADAARAALDQVSAERPSVSDAAVWDAWMLQRIELARRWTREVASEMERR